MERFTRYGGYPCGTEIEKGEQRRNHQPELGALSGHGEPPRRY
jgi:hypothetical protein